MAARILAPGRSFYVYLHRRATDGAVFYVGKGRGRRAKKHQQRNPHWQNIAAKHGWTVEFVAVDVQQWYALELEKDLIAYYGRDVLCNMTDGGDGKTGHVVSEETKASISRSLSGIKRSPEWRLASSLRQKGKVITDEQRRKISATLMGRPANPDGIRKMAESRRGVPRPPQVAERLRSAWRDPVRNAARRVAMAAASVSIRSVRCIETGVVFDRMRAAEDWLRSEGLLKSSKSTITKCVNGRGKTCCGYRWEYA